MSKDKKDWIDVIFGTIIYKAKSGFYITSGAAMMGAFLIGWFFWKILPTL